LVADVQAIRAREAVILQYAGDGGGISSAWPTMGGVKV